MLNVDSIERGIVIDHIKAGRGMFIYNYLKLDELDSCIALIKNVRSEKQGKKDLIKIDDIIDINLEVLGFIDPKITVNIVEKGHIVKKINLALPDTIVDVVKCKNPRCITSVENSINHEFRLTDMEKGSYRCVYCDSIYSAG
ncbi:MAG: aspartate carbamoyltransferase regulatory subunit [Synergistaceae bacterium]|nr:aspartate carbamoyltransferase regulatory subunit [Synergistaceae bacterium]